MTNSKSPGRPTRLPGAAYLGPLLAIALVALGAIGIRDLIIRWGWVDHQSPWVSRVFSNIGDLQWHDWMIAIAVALIVVGLWALLVALKPRARSHQPVPDTDSWFIRRADIARRCSSVARDLDGVADASTVVGKRTTTTTLTPLPGSAVTDEELRQRTRAALEPELAQFGGGSKVVVKIRKAPTPQASSSTSRAATSSTSRAATSSTSRAGSATATGTTEADATTLGASLPAPSGGLRAATISRRRTTTTSPLAVRRNNDTADSSTTDTLSDDSKEARS